MTVATSTGLESVTGTADDGAALRLSVATPSVCLLQTPRVSEGGASPIVCLLPLFIRKEVNVSAHGLRLSQTSYGMLHVMDTHTHLRIYSVTVAMPRPMLKLIKGI